jgi:hypothetical protein
MLTTATHSLSPKFLTKEALTALRDTFMANEYVYLPQFFRSDYQTALHREVLTLEAGKIARDFVMPGYNTPRYMQTIGGSHIARSSGFLMSLYRDEELQWFLRAVTGSRVYPCTNPSEFMAINFLENEGGTHGWHLDDPEFGLIFVLEAPPASSGGMLEFVPRWREHCKLAELSEESDPTYLVGRLRDLGIVQSRHHAAGDAFLLRAHDALHRVTPLTAIGHRRLILNLAYQDVPVQSYGNTASLLYEND